MSPFVRLWRQARSGSDDAIILISSWTARRWHRRDPHMADPHVNRVPVYSWVVPFLALLAALLIGHSESWALGVVSAIFLIASVLVAVHHAEVVAHWLGEPYGTLVLTLAVTIIELSLIVSMMLTGEPSATLARDAVHAVLMLV